VRGGVENDGLQMLIRDKPCFTLIRNSYVDIGGREVS